MEVDENTHICTTTMKCELNTLSRADGSCILCENDTVMAVAIYGPVEVKQHKMLIDKAFIEIIFKPKCGTSQIGDRLYESIVGKICESAILTSFYPRTAVNVIIQEMQSDGDVLACCINATCLALIHAGIAMNYLFAAVTMPVRTKSSVTTSTIEIEEIGPKITFVFENTSDKILAVNSCGKITDMEYSMCLKKCRSSSGIIFKFYKDMISKYAVKM